MVDLGVGRDGGGKAVGVAAARDYIYGRLEELRPVILSERGARRQEAKDERDFLQQELVKVLRQGRGTVEVDPNLARAVRERSSRRPAAPPSEAPRTVFPLNTAAERAAAGDGRETGEDSRRAAGSTVRPPYWATCEAMDFGELRGFIDDSLRAPPDPKAGSSPRRKQEFVDLLQLLALKGGVELDGDLRPVADPDKDALELRKARGYRERLSRMLSTAQRDPASRKGARRRKALERRRKLEQELARVKSEIARLEAQKRGVFAGPRTEEQRQRHLKAQRTDRVVRVRRDIERVFAEGGPGAGPSTDGPAGRAGGNRLPWRVLPPGELTLERVLAHYERLARAYPERGYMPERIEKARSLGPSKVWEGRDGFDGYVVFEYPGTDRVLLECGVYGNAIYVLGPRWKELSRRSKREVLEDPSSRRILHRGEWFATLKAELGLQ